MTVSNAIQDMSWSHHNNPFLCRTSRALQTFNEMVDYGSNDHDGSIPLPVTTTRSRFFPQRKGQGAKEKKSTNTIKLEAETSGIEICISDGLFISTLSSSCVNFSVQPCLKPPSRGRPGWNPFWAKSFLREFRSASPRMTLQSMWTSV